MAALVATALAASPAHADPPAFTPDSAAIATGWSPVAAVADLNGDGRQDIVVASDHGSNATVTVALGQPGGGHEAAGAYAVVDSPRALRLVDLSGDGRLDIVVAGSTEFTILHAQPGGGFAEAYRRALIGELGVGDFDGDKASELAFVQIESRVYVASAQRDGSYAERSYRTITLPDGVQVGDWTGDGRDDVLAVHARGGDSSLLAGAPDGLGPAVLYNRPGWERPLRRDLDRDGDVDLAVLDGLHLSVIVYRARGDDADYEPYWIGEKVVSDMLADDFDGDRRGDLAMLTMTKAGRVRLTLLLGAPDGRFAAPVALSLGDEARDFTLASGDLDGDARPDLIVAEGSSDYAVRVWHNRAPTLPAPTPTVGAQVDGTGDAAPAASEPPAFAPAPPAATVMRRARLAFDARAGVRTTRLRRLRVENLAPGTTVSVRCARGCSRRSLTIRHAQGTVSLASFARERLRAGTTLRVTIAEPGRPITVLTLRIRAGRAPHMSRSSTATP